MAGSLKERAEHELRRFLLTVAYLWAMFFLFQVHEYVILATHGISFEKFGLGLVNALVFGKIMVVADSIRFRAWWRGKPLIVPILARTVAFALLFLVVHALESLITGAMHHKPFSESLPTYGGGGLLGGVLVGIIIAFALMPFFAFELIDEALGEGRLRALLLKAREGD